MAEYAPVQETLAPAAGPPIDPDVLDQRRKLAQALIAKAMGGEPIGSWTQGVANLAQALMGGYTVRKANQQEAAGRASGAADTAAALEAIMAGGGGGYGGDGETADEPGTEAVSSAPTSDVEAYIRQSASKRGIDPNVAVRVARSEGLAPGVWQSNVRRNGQRETSYGPYQLLVGGGLGDKFIRQTGLNPRDPSTVKAQVDFALDQARQGGWSPWYGAAKVGVGNWTGIGRGGGGETAALPNVDPVAAAMSPDVAAFIGGGGNQPQPAGLSIGDGAVAPLPRPRPEPPTELPYDSGADPRTPQPRPNLAQALALPPASGRGTVPLPPLQPVARTPQPRPTTPPAPAAAAAAPTTTASIPQPQPRRQIFREPASGAPLSAQEFARQGQNYLTGRGSFANQTPRVAPRTMQEPVGPGTPGGAPAAAAPAQPRRGLLDALFGRQAPGQPAAVQPAPASSPVAAGATAAPADSPLARLMANPYVDPAIKAAVFARAYPKPRDPMNVPAGGTVYDPNTNQPLYTAPDKPEPRKIQNDANGVPRYTDTGEPVYSGDEGTGGEFFTGKSVEAQGLNFLINEGTLTKEQAANVAAGKTITAADGSLIFMTPSGIVRKPPGSDAAGGDDGGYVISGPKTAGTEAETKAGGFADRMRESGRIIDSLETEGTSLAGKAVGDIPILGNYLVSDKYRQYQQAQRDFINSQLRRESGAVISDAEFENAKKQYFPQPNDDAKTIANKRRNRALAVEGMKRSAGPLYKPAPEEAPEAASAIEKGAPGSSKDNPVRVGTQADYDRLPSGAYYVDDDGSIKVKS